MSLQPFLLLYLIVSVLSWQNADVRLNLDGDYSKGVGVLEMFFTSVCNPQPCTKTWVAVCGNSINFRAVSTACRQLGYCTANNYRISSKWVRNRMYACIVIIQSHYTQYNYAQVELKKFFLFLFLIVSLHLVIITYQIYNVH